jgi:TetR/AcrR family transcriptional regulator, transcriptional repressor for nem operon
MADLNLESKTALLMAARAIFRRKGYAATDLQDICEAAQLTTAIFFRHFKSKEDLAIAAAEQCIEAQSPMLLHSTYRTLPDPVDRILGYIDYRKSLLLGGLPEITCFAGTILQEIYETRLAARDGCEKSISAHAAVLVADIDEAMQLYDGSLSLRAEGLALFILASIEGAFILAKAKQRPAVAADCLDYLRGCIELVFAFHRPNDGGRSNGAV